MNMNKKIFLYGFILIISIFMFNIDVRADDKSCNTYASQGKSVCEQHSYGNYQCKWDGNKKGGARCYKSDKLTKEKKESLQENAKSCSEITDSNVCVNSKINGHSCIYRQNTCTESLAESDSKENVINDERTTITTTKSKKSSSSSVTEWKNKACSELSANDCKKRQDCALVGGFCSDAQVASNPCDEDSLRKVLKIFGYVLMIMKFMVPLLIIGFGIFDLYKAVVDKDEKSLSKQLKMIAIRLICGLVVFFLPNIIFVFLDSIDKSGTKEQGYQTCAECVLKPNANNLCTIAEDSD